MATLTTEDVADLVAATLRDLDKGKWTDLTGDIQEYVAMPELLKGDKVVEKKNGNGCKVNIQYTTNGQARWVGLREVDSYNDVDTLTNGFVPWRHMTFNYSFDRREEEINDGDPAQIVDYVAAKRAAAFIDAAILFENAFWGKPATSADTRTMWGLYMYLVSNASTGFNGGNPSGFTTGAVFDSTVQTRWLNYTAQYTNVTKADLIRKMRAASVKTKFKSPIQMKEIRQGEIKRGIYTNYDVISAVEELAEAQNENLGNDVASKDGQAYFRKLPWIYVPQLDSDSTDPVFGIDWSTLIPVFLKGENFNESKPYALKGTQHTMVAVDVDCTLNLVCYDRRRQFRIQTA